MAAFEDETTRRKREFNRDRRLRAGMPANWREQLGLEPERQDAPQNAQNAPGGQQAPQAAPVAPQVNFLPDARQRAQDGRERQQERIASQIAHVEGAFRDENDSRVAQAREAKRMEFTRDIERMRQESLLQRLAMEQSDNPRRFVPQSPLAVRSWNPATGQWEYREPDEDGNIGFGG